jgi:hypothetical protein
MEGDSFEVALLTMHHPPTIKWSGYLKNANLYWYKYIQPGVDEYDEELGFVDREKRFLGDFRHVNIGNIGDLIQAMNRKAKSWLTATPSAVVTADEAGTVTFSLEREIKVQLSIKLAFLLCELRAPPTEKYFEILIGENGNFVSPGTANLDRCLPQHLLLQCDFISPTIMGGKYSNILKMFPLLDNSLSKKKYCTVSSANLDFVDVSTDKLSTTHFELRDQEGYPIFFKQQQNLLPQPTSITLLFRKKKN